MTKIYDRLTNLRRVMQQKQIDALIVPSADAHMSEYLPKYYQGRAWLSGFTGSVGTLVVAQDFAHLWADSRYWLQASDELQGTTIVLKKHGQEPKDYAETLVDLLDYHQTIAIDGMTYDVRSYERLKALCDKKNINIQLFDVIGELWHDRPALPNAPIYAHDERFVDELACTKLQKVRDDMTQHGAKFHLISSLDDIAWLTNLRGSDVECNPVFLAHMLISGDEAVIFTHDTLTDNAKQRLAQTNIRLQDYKDINEALANVGDSILFDPHNVAISIAQCIPKTVQQIHKTNPSTLLKAVKSAQALDNVRAAMICDGVALCEFFCEFEQKLAQGERLSELDVDFMLIEKRSQQDNYIGPSFDTIAGFGGNGAIVHYRAKPDNFSFIQGDGLLLIDSGAQYQNGTTDITRMMGIGKVCDKAKADVTYVLKAHIALAQAVFPVGVSSVVLDTVARMPLWQAYRDYGHGTGHGVGYFLNVHEGPQVIAYSAPKSDQRVMKLGMITSNEPGLYRTGKWGVRIENLLACVPSACSEFGEFATFEDLTLCPIDTRIILPNLLSDNEKAWLNHYHKKVYDALIDKVSDNAKAWLIERTQAI